MIPGTGYVNCDKQNTSNYRYLNQALLREVDKLLLPVRASLGVKPSLSFEQHTITANTFYDNPFLNHNYERFLYYRIK
jgi:hypothetical protein